MFTKMEQAERIGITADKDIYKARREPVPAESFFKIA